jgi:RNA polymerase sigma-70 factor (ECF subfamily)
MTSGLASGLVEDLAQRHLDAAYNLGRWLLGNEHDAADAVHDAFVRATRSAHTYAGGNARAWWLAIVRNCCLAKLTSRQRETQQHHLSLVQAELPASDPNEIEERMEANQRQALIKAQLRLLPPEFREALVLREIEDLSYREIADVLGVPIGTVMSRLARGRALLQRALSSQSGEEKTHGL